MSPIQSALHPAGPQSASIGTLWSVFLWVSIAVYLLVVVFLFIAIARGRRNSEPLAGNDRSATIAVSTSTGLTVAILIGLLVTSVAAGHAIGTFGGGNPEQLEIEVTGHQWWWEITYPNSTDPSMAIKSANEIHIPVGKPVLFRVDTRDVIHSLWIPNLHGKLDLIPGRVNKFRMQADRAGIYRAQCAEFCGLQHANMSLVVYADPPAKFAQWQTAQRQPAPEPKTPSAKRGKEVFLAAPCANCHNITGAEAYATLGPDLTHIASRPTLAAGALINNRGNLAGWISNPGAIKPGTAMPGNQLGPGELQDLVEYMETLK